MGKLKTIRRKIRRPFETGGIVLFRFLIPLLPRCVVVGLSRMIGKLAWWLPVREKKIGLKNINAVFGDTKTPQEKRRILTQSFATFCLTMLDIVWFSRNPERRIHKYVVFEEGALRDTLFEDKPLICITAHMGSWEILGQTAALMGSDLASIAATVKNATVDRILINLRERTGQTIIPQKGALRTLIARFRENGKAAFVLDQVTPKADGGIMVDFLGLPMPVSSAPAALAYRTGTKIILGFSLPEPGGRYQLRISKSIIPPPFDKQQDMDEIVHRLTQQIQDSVSDEIRTHPEFWLWSYKHWRRIPGESYPEHYPTY